MLKRLRSAGYLCACIFSIFLFQIVIAQAQSNLRSGTTANVQAGSGGTADLDPVQPRADIIAHSPEVEAMAKHAVMPMTLYSGMPQISVPIFDLKLSGLTLPFSLSYNYNGFKPTEMASSVGLGWSLQGGGSIAKIIKGKIDGTMNSGNNYDDLIAVDALTWSQSFLTSIVQGTVDVEPDVYVFNAGGYSGKFIMVKGVAYLFPFQNLKITQNGAYGFTMIDDKGNTFSFNDIETTYIHNSDVPNHTSAWHLTKVITADKLDTVDFEYTGYSFKQNSTFTDRYTIDSRSTGQSTDGQTCSRTSVDGDMIQALVLSSVSSRKGQLEFWSTTGRLDLPGSDGGNSLDKVVISKPDGQLLKEVVLVHSYFGNNSKLKLTETFERQFDNSGEFAVPVIDNHYRFNYQGEVSDLSYLNNINGTDYWGYANGANNEMLFDSQILGLNYTIHPYANRAPNSSISNRGIISKITYPEGGYSVFQFEQNKKGSLKVLNTYTDKTLGNGAIYSTYDSKRGYTEEKVSFSIAKAQNVFVLYGDNDTYKAPTLPVLKIYKNRVVVYTSPLYNLPAESAYDTIFLSEGDYQFGITCENGIVSDEAIGTYATWGNLTYRAYDINNTIEDAPGLRLKTISTYDAINAAPAVTKQYSYNNGVELTKGGYSVSAKETVCAGIWDTFTTTSIVASSRSALSDLAETQFYYGEVTETTQDATKTGKTVYTFGTPSNQLYNVKLLSQTDFKFLSAAYVPVKLLVNTYNQQPKYSFTGFKAYKAQSVGNNTSNLGGGCGSLVSPDYTVTYIVNDTYSVDPSEVYALVGDYVQLTSTKETLYGTTVTDTVVSRSDYYYDNPDHTYQTRIFSRKSNGEIYIKEIKYPLDYNYGSCSTQDFIQTNFVNDIANAVMNMGNTLSEEVNALGTAVNWKSWTFLTTSQQQTFANIAAQYHIIPDFRAAIAAAVSTRNTALSTRVSCLNTAIGGSLPSYQKAASTMLLNNNQASPLETFFSVKANDGNEYLDGAKRTEFAIFNSNVVEPVLVKQTEIASNVLKSSFLASPDNYYKSQLSFTYDADLSLVGQLKLNDAPISYVYAYRQEYPVAEVVNATFSQVLTAMGLTAAQYKAESTALYPSASFLTKVNALRQTLPAARVKTYTFDPLVGMTSMTDENGFTTTFQFDLFGRLTSVKDKNGSVVKGYTYHIKP